MSYSKARVRELREVITVSKEEQTDERSPLKSIFSEKKPKQDQRLSYTP